MITKGDLEGRNFRYLSHIDDRLILPTTKYRVFYIKQKAFQTFLKYFSNPSKIFYISILVYTLLVYRYSISIFPSNLRLACELFVWKTNACTVLIVNYSELKNENNYLNGASKCNFFIIIDLFFVVLEP